MTARHQNEPDYEPQDFLGYLELTLRTAPEGYTYFGEFVDALGPRSFGLAILIFALPMIIPMPPGIPMTAGLAIAIISVQLILGRKHLWLPQSLAEKKIENRKLASAYKSLDRYLGWVFRLTRPRFPQMTGDIAIRLAGFIFFILGVLMILPIPFIGNILPAFACSVIALALTDRDGLLYCLGIIIAGLAAAAVGLMAIGTISLLSTNF